MLDRYIVSFICAADEALCEGGFFQRFNCIQMFKDGFKGFCLKLVLKCPPHCTSCPPTESFWQISIYPANGQKGRSDEKLNAIYVTRGFDVHCTWWGHNCDISFPHKKSDIIAQFPIISTGQRYNFMTHTKA